MSKFVTSESVTEGHPDKVCDQISDAVLDELLSQDKLSRVAVETFATVGCVVVGGEVTTSGYVNLQKVVRKVLRDIGYTSKFGFDANTCAIVNMIGSQSPDIAQGVDAGGAGDQGLMFGYACNETEELMPLPIILAHKLTRRLADVRKSGLIPYLGPDGKSQVTVEFCHDGHVRVDSVVLAAHHTDKVLNETGKSISDEAWKELVNLVVSPVVGPYVDSSTKYFVNATGKFVVGGPRSDTGMTGRKIIVDTYGGVIPHGGGAFSGKDPSKVDRSASYMARYIAKNIVKAGLAKRCMVSLAYVIGVPEPTMIEVETFGTSSLSSKDFVCAIKDVFDLTPKGIIAKLDLLRPIYLKTAAYGHFGNPDFPWEKVDMVGALLKAVGLD